MTRTQRYVNGDPNLGLRIVASETKKEPLVELAVEKALNQTIKTRPSRANGESDRGRQEMNDTNGAKDMSSRGKRGERSLTA